MVEYRKTLESLLWAMNREPGIGIYRLMKGLTYAEYLSRTKHHVPLTGDHFVDYGYGLFPSFAYDLARQELITLDVLNLDSFPFEFGVVFGGMFGRKEGFSAKIKDNEVWLSQTELECLKDGLAQYKDLTFSEIQLKAKQSDETLKEILKK